MDSDTLYGRIIPSHPEYNIHGYFNLSSQKFGQADANVLDFNNDVSNVVVYDKTIYFTNTAPQGTPMLFCRMANYCTHIKSVVQAGSANVSCLIGS